MAKAKLVRRFGRLLRKAGRLTRSSVDLDPDSPCECCEDPPPDPLWFCDYETGQCIQILAPGGYSTQQECQLHCQQIVCPSFCYYEVAKLAGKDCPSATTAGAYAYSYVDGTGATLCRVYYPIVPMTMPPAANDYCNRGSPEIATYYNITQSSTLPYKRGTTAGIACLDGNCRPVAHLANGQWLGGCPDNLAPVNVFP